MVKYALLIGINYYGSDHQLAGCIDDIDEMKEYLLQHGYTDFTMLQDSPDDVQHKKPDCPTRDNMIAAMSAAVTKLQSGDTLFVHYSGHGSQLDCVDGSKKEGVDACICPVDFDFNAPDCGFIRDSQLNTLLVKQLPAGAKLRVVFDACHSGSALDLPYRYTDADKFYTESDDVLSKDVVYISGCRDAQTSADTSFNGVADGALSWALMSALEKAVSDGSAGKITWRDLIHTIRQELKENDYEQLPQLDVEDKKQLLLAVDLF